jgi:hypothetical protein
MSVILADVNVGEVGAENTVTLPSHCTDTTFSIDMAKLPTFLASPFSFTPLSFIVFTSAPLSLLTMNRSLDVDAKVLMDVDAKAPEVIIIIPTTKRAADNTAFFFSFANTLFSYAPAFASFSFVVLYEHSRLFF